MFALLLLACGESPVETEVPWGPPDQAGPWAAGVTTFQVIGAHDEEIQVEVWYPALQPEGADPSPYLEIAMAGTAFREATPATESGPFPLIAFSHGSQGIRYQSIYLTEHWASHGFVVVADSLPANVVMSHKSLFDGSLEGIRVTDAPVFSVQYHPEASPGPHDSHYLFEWFVEMIDDQA